MPTKRKPTAVTAQRVSQAGRAKAFTVKVVNRRGLELRDSIDANSAMEPCEAKLFL